MEHQHPLFSFEHFSFTYPFGKKSISLQGSHHITKDTTILLSGNSGSGKSTLLYGLKGLIPTTIRGTQQGSIYYKGMDMRSLTPMKQLEIGMVFQNPNAQMLTSTVWKELALGLENLTYTPQEIKDRIIYYAERCNISHLLLRNIQTLSGGEKQKVALVSILAMEPDVMLLDEPTAFLDPFSAQAFTDFFRSYRQKKTIIVVEHNIAYLKDHIDELWTVQKNDTSHYASPSHHGTTSHLTKEPFSDSAFPPLLASTYHAPPFHTHADIVLSVEHITYSYHKDHTLLQDIDFSVRKGEIVGIQGNNGEGKSTLLNIIAGLTPPQEGRVLLHHKNIRQMARNTIYEELAYVFQNPDLHFLYNSVKEELAGDLHILAGIGLEIESERNPFTLSEGEKRRLSLAIMWRLRRNIYILDEPTFGQDHDNKEKLTSLIHAMVEEGKSFVIVSHDRDFLKAVSHSIMTLEQGRMSRA